MTVDDFLDFILPEVVGCPTETARVAVLRTAIDFCTRTHAWNLIQDPVPLFAGSNEYDVDKPLGSEVVTVKNVWCGPTELLPVNMHELQMRLPNWREARGSAPSFYNATGEKGTITVWPIPTAPLGDPLVIRAVYRPLMTSTSLPLILTDEYSNALEAGTKSRLFLMAKQSWSDASLGAFFDARYKELLFDGQASVFHEKVQGSVRVRPVPFR